jgi:hypothetical protein
MSGLITWPNLTRHDEIYQRLIDLHSGLDEKQTSRVNARLILLLMNHAGDVEAILQAIDIAGGGRNDP